MPSKFDRLREGEAVEFKPGLVGKLNPSDKSIEFSDGFKVDVSQDRDIYPSNPEALAHSREKEKIKKEISSSPLGKFGYQLGESGIFRSAKEWAGKLDLTQTGDEYLRNRRASQEVSEEISESNPYTSMAAGAAAFIPDLLLTKGMGAGRAAAGLSLAHAGPRIIEEPGQVAAEAAISGAGGYLLGKGANAIENIAARRGLSRQVSQAAKEIPSRNAAGQAAVRAANEEQSGAYNLIKERVSRENEALLHQHRLEMNAHKQRALEAQNSFEKAKFDRESEIFRIKQEKEAAKAARSSDQARLDREYETAVNAWKQEKKALESQAAFAEKQYQESLKDLPRLQKEAQAQYGKEVVRAAKDIEKAFHAEGTVTANQLQIPQFVDAQISKGGLAGSPSASSAKRIIQAIFPEGEAISAKELAKRYEALEGAIARSNPEVRGLLTEFKEHIGGRLPNALADNIAYKAVLPSLENQISKGVDKVIRNLTLPKAGGLSHDSLSKIAKERLNGVLKEVGPDGFIEKMRSGELSTLLKNGLLREEDFTSALLKAPNLKKLKNQGVDYLLKESTDYQALQSAYNHFASEAEKSINNFIARNELKLLSAQDKATKKLGGKIEGTFGMAEPVEPPRFPERSAMPEAPIRPAPLPEVANVPLPPPVSPPPIEPAPVSPVLGTAPRAPVPQTFTPEAVPTLPPAQGMAEAAGDFLEKDLFGGKGVLNNPLAKLAGLKFLLGKGALPVEAGYAALKGLTSPTAGGAAARTAVRRGGVEAIAQLAEKYPSYHDGILDNPQERRSLTKEIEDDPEMTLEQKALAQSKVNRGRSLFERL